MATEPIDPDQTQALEDDAHRIRAEHDAMVASTWMEVPLGPILAGDVRPPEPTILRRTDGVALLYRGKTHGFHGEFESGKTWAALAATAETIRAAKHVLYVDFEDDAETFILRLRQLGVRDADIAARAHYIRPDRPLTDANARAALANVGDRHRPALVVLDGVTEAYALHHLNPDKMDDVARFLDLMPRRWDQTGAAVVLIDHVVKSRDDRGNYAIGSQHKMAGINGAAYKFVAKDPLSPDREGVVDITVTKDRPGRVRRFADSRTEVGTMRLLPAPDRGPDCLDIEFRRPAYDWEPSEGLVEAVENALRTGPATKTAICAATGRSNDDVGKTLQWLKNRGRVDGEDRRSWTLQDRTDPDPTPAGSDAPTRPDPDPTP